MTLTLDMSPPGKTESVAKNATHAKYIVNALALRPICGRTPTGAFLGVKYVPDAKSGHAFPRITTSRRRSMAKPGSIVVQPETSQADRGDTIQTYSHPNGNETGKLNPCPPDARDG